MSCDLPITSMLGKCQTVLARLVKDIMLLLLVHMAWPTLRADDQPAPIVGEVIFVSHAAWMHSPGHPPVRLQEGDIIHVGATLETAPDAQLHLKMIDGAFIALRPGTRLHIRDYRQPTPDAPDVGIKLELIQGSMRSITGHIGESHKAHFRLNTPIAAIGIRGTDFSLRSTAASTQASIFSGAIVLSPFDIDCAREALGPCLGANSLVAQASTDTYVELRAGAERPSIVPTIPTELLPTPEEERSRKATTVSSHPASSAEGGVPFTLVAPAPQILPAAEENDRRMQVVQDNRQAEQPLPTSRIDSSDADGDGLDQEAERMAGTNPFSQDTDGDGMPDSLDPRPITSDFYAIDQKTVQLTPQQLAAFRFHSIQIERSTWGNQPALIQRITLISKEATGKDTPSSLTVERRQDEEGRVFWGSAASFGLLEEALRANPTEVALGQELRDALLATGVSPENASLTALEWLNYHRTPPGAATVSNTTRYLVSTQGLERATTPPINQHYSSFNQLYKLNVQDAARQRPDGTAENLPITDFKFKMNYADRTFTATISVLDPRPGRPVERTTVEFRGVVSESGMIFGGNDQAYLKGFFLNEMRQIALLFERLDERGILGGTILAQRDDTHTDTERLQPRMALYQTNPNAPVLWGRWEHFAHIRDISELTPILDDTRELIAYNNSFALLRPKPTEDFTLPAKGNFSFAMEAHEAIYRHDQGLELAQVHNPYLNIDFDRRTFATHLNLTAPSLAAPVAVTAHGPVGENGVFRSDPSHSNGTVVGFIAPNATHAGTLFERQLDTGGVVTGVVQWRQR